MVSGRDLIIWQTQEKYDELENFVTSYDDVEYGQKQYEKGLKIGSEYKEVHIAVNEVWSASIGNEKHIFSHEKIGYHKNTKDLLRGFLDSDAKVIVHVFNYSNDEPVIDVVIKE